MTLLYIIMLASYVKVLLLDIRIWLVVWCLIGLVQLVPSLGTEFVLLSCLFTMTSIHKCVKNWYFCILSALLISGGLSLDFAGSGQNLVTAKKTSASWVESQRVILLLRSLINNIYLAICIGLIRSYLKLWHLILSP